MATKDLKGHRLYLFVGSDADFKHEGKKVKGRIERAWWGDRLSNGSHAICVQVKGETFVNITNVRFKSCTLTAA